MLGTAFSTTIPQPRPAGLRRTGKKSSRCPACGSGSQSACRRQRRLCGRLTTVVALTLITATHAARGRAEPPELLVQRLGSGRAAVREQAARDLVALGPDVLPAVVAARDTATGEPRFRLEGIQRQLERLAASRAVEPATVSLAAREVPAREALASIFAESGSRIDLDPLVSTGGAGNRPVTLALDRATFWEAIDDLLDRAGLSLAYAPEPPGLAIVDRESTDGRGRDGPVVAAGPLRVAVARVEPTGLPPPPDQPRSRGARVTLRVAWEPRLEPLMLRLPARSIVAEGPAGEAVPPAQRLAVIEAAIPDGRPWLDLPLQLAAPAVPLDSLGMLRGTMVVWLAGREHEFHWNAIPGGAGRPAAGAARGGATQQVAAVEVSLLEAVRRDGMLVVRTRVEYAAASEALASHHTWLASRPVRASLTDGLEFRQVEQRVESRSDRGMTAAARFDLGALDPGALDLGRFDQGGSGPDRAGSPGLQIRWQVPIAIHEVPIDFALRGIPLAPP